ncbi:MAG: GIY-YIG nuclease family protein [bacterium]|nr:GIY-YIG nuclease family protein [bacterium]
MTNSGEKHFVYIIKSQKTGRFYTGLTKNLFRRLQEHEKGRPDASKITHLQGPFVLIHAEECSSYKHAVQRELFWKSGIGRQIRATICKKLLI